MLSVAQTGQNPGEEGEPDPADFALELVDIHGKKAVLSLSTIAPLQPEINAEILKAGFLSQDPTSEAVFQTYLFDLADFLAENPAFSLADLFEIRLVFNRTDAGEIVLDNLGFRKANLVQ